MLHTALKAAEEISHNGNNIGVIDMFHLSNFSARKLKDICSSYSGLITLEEGFRGRGGLDSMLFEFISRENIPVKMLNIGVEPGYSFELGTREELHEKVGIGLNSVVSQVKTFMKNL